MNVTVKTNVKELEFFGSCAELDSEYQPIKTVGEYLALINKKLETCGRTC